MSCIFLLRLNQSAWWKICDYRYVRAISPPKHVERADDDDAPCSLTAPLVQLAQWHDRKAPRRVQKGRSSSRAMDRSAAVSGFRLRVNVAARLSSTVLISM